MSTFTKLFWTRSRLLSSFTTVGERLCTWSAVLSLRGKNSHLCYALYCSSGLEGIMPKRTTSDEVCMYPKKKERHQEAALKLESGSNSNEMALNNSNSESGYSTNFETKDFSPSQKDSALAARDGEDSGFVDLPDSGQTLECKPHIPGFRLNHCRAFPSPKFDAVPSETADISRSGDEESGGNSISARVLTKVNYVSENRGTAAGDDGSAARQTVSHTYTETDVSDLLVLPSAEVIKTKSRTSLSAGHDWKHVAVTEENISALGNIDEQKLQLLTAVSKCSTAQTLEKQSSKPSLQTQKEAMTNPEASANNTEKQDETVLQSRHGAEAMADTTAGQTKPDVPTKSTSARKRQTHIKDSTSDLPSSSSKRKRKKEEVKAVISDKPSKASGRLKTRTVLPASLLDQIVNTVQVNVRTISTQVVAAAAVKPPKTPPSTATSSETSNSSKTDGTRAFTESERENKVLVMHKERLLKLINVMEMEIQDSQFDVDHGNVGEQCGMKQTEAAEKDTVMKETLQNAKVKVTTQDTANTGDATTKTSKKPRASKKTKSRVHRKSGADHHESPLGILPEYVPENDSRLHKASKPGQVYNLSALFSGKLGVGQKEEQKKRKRPNYFFAVQITNTEIKENLILLQKEVEEAEPKLKPAFVSVDSAHITLGVMHLEDQEAIDRAKAGLEDFLTSHLQYRQESLQTDGREGEGSSVHDPLTLELRGLGHFNNNVVFAKVTEGDSLKRLEAMADLLKLCTLKQNIALDEKEFAAHLTVMKHSKNPAKLKKSGIKKISSDVYKASSDKTFGVELVTTVQLCSMLKPKKNNYYHIEHEVSLVTLKKAIDKHPSEDE